MAHIMLCYYSLHWLECERFNGYQLSDIFFGNAVLCIFSQFIMGVGKHQALECVTSLPVLTPSLEDLTQNLHQPFYNCQSFQL